MSNTIDDSNSFENNSNIGAKSGNDAKFKNKYDSKMREMLDNNIYHGAIFSDQDKLKASINACFDNDPNSVIFPITFFTNTVKCPPCKKLWSNFFNIAIDGNKQNYYLMMDKLKEMFFNITYDILLKIKNNDYTEKEKFPIKLEEFDAIEQLKNISKKTEGDVKKLAERIVQKIQCILLVVDVDFSREKTAGEVYSLTKTMNINYIPRLMLFALNSKSEELVHGKIFDIDDYPDLKNDYDFLSVDNPNGVFFNGKKLNVLNLESPRFGGPNLDGESFLIVMEPLLKKMSDFIVYYYFAIILPTWIDQDLIFSEDSLRE